ncbi:GM21040 [Drosophila sechellia]|uniref:GM21040 n=1 Tax=Drosophila sechellia TaxID=7238 RepID=B4HRY4_DROSE|nr:GM21040 [Drosophila sechellia]
MITHTSKTLQNGSKKYQALSEDIFVVQRSLTKSDTIVLVINFGSVAKTVDLSQFDKSRTESLQLLIRSIDSTKKEGTRHDPKALSLDPSEALVLTTE